MTTMLKSLFCLMAKVNSYFDRHKELMIESDIEKLTSLLTHLYYLSPIYYQVWIISCMKNVWEHTYIYIWVVMMEQKRVS